jgi:hypothetical protein
MEFCPQSKLPKIACYRHLQRKISKASSARETDRFPITGDFIQAASDHWVSGISLQVSTPTHIINLLFDGLNSA